MSQTCNNILKDEYNYINGMTADKSCMYNLCYRTDNDETEINVEYNKLINNDDNVIPGFRYIYVIRKDAPQTVYYMNETESYYSDKTYYVCDESARGIDGKKGWYGRTRKRINHNCLAHNTNIICGGEFELIDSQSNTLRINNQSGHYQPNRECLNYAKCIFESLGYNTLIKNAIGGKSKRTKRKKSKLTKQKKSKTVKQKSKTKK